MKRLFALCAVAGVVGCGPLTFESEKKASFSVHVAADAEKAFTAHRTIDLAADPDFAQYKDNMKAVEVESAILRVTKSPSETPSACTQASGIVYVAETETAEGVVFATYEPISVAEGTVVDLMPQSAGVEELKRLALGSGHKFTVIAAGEPDQVPCHFDFEIVLGLVVTADL